MSEREAIARTPGGPATVASLSRDLRALGAAPGQVILVHCSLSALGWVCGGPVAVLQALDAVTGLEGTLAMPAHSGGLSDPGDWKDPPVPESWWAPIREGMPAFDPALTPTRGMGAVAECFRSWPGTLRSPHPQVSFCARGPRARAVAGSHALDYGLGEGSPLARLYDLGAWVLLLGVGNARNTSLHLAEYRTRLPGQATMRTALPVMGPTGRKWRPIEDLVLDDGDFGRIGDEFARDTGLVREGAAGAGRARFMPQRELVDYAVAWMRRNRGRPGG